MPTRDHRAREAPPCPVSPLHGPPRFLFTKDAAGFYRCPTCGSYVTDAEYDSEAYERAGRDRADHVTAEFVLSHWGFRWGVILDEIERVVPPPAKLLDVGAGNGGFVRLAVDRGYDASGVTMSERDVGFGRRELGVTLERGTLEGFAGSGYDVVCANSVIEHVGPEPRMEEFARELGGSEPEQPQQESPEPTAEQAAEQQAAEQQAAEQQAAEPVDPLAPRVLETKPFGRVEVPIAGPFDSAPLVKSAFELSEEQPLPDSPLRLGEDWFIYRLQSRERADRADFTEEVKAEITRVLLFVKRRDALAEYVSRLNKEALARNALRVRQVAKQQESDLQQ